MMIETIENKTHLILDDKELDNLRVLAWTKNTRSKDYGFRAELIDLLDLFMVMKRNQEFFEKRVAK